MGRDLPRLIVFAVLALLLRWAGAEEMRATPGSPRVTPSGWSWDLGATYGSNSFDPPPSRSWDRVPSGIRGIDTHTLPGRAGPLVVQRTLTAPLSAVGAALARCWGNALCATASMVAVPLVLDRLRVDRDPVDGTLKLDPGQDPIDAGSTGSYYCPQSPTSPCQLGQPAATSAPSIDAIPTYSPGCKGYPGSSGFTYTCTPGAFEPVSPVPPFNPAPVGSAPNSVLVGRFPIFVTSSSGGSGTVYWNVNRYDYSSSTGGSQCPASIDPGNPEYNVPAGQPVGVDGKCPTARYNWAPITPPAVGARFEQYAPDAGGPASSNGVDALREALERGETIPDAVSSPATGPASQTGQPTTTTTVDPTGTTTTTQTPTYNYNYGDTYITYNITTTTITTHPNGTTTTTTTNTPAPTPGAAAPSDLCALHPDAVACARVGQPGTTQPQVSNQTIAYEADSLGLPAACPAPWEFPVPLTGGTWQMSFSMICDVAPQVRIALLVACTLGAALFVVAGVRS